MFKKLFDSGLKELKRCKKIAQLVMNYDEEMQKLSDEELQAKTPYFKELLKNGKTLDDILPEAYAVVREAASRVIHKKPFFVQIVGGIILHGGNVAEMRTGEGKTLTAVAPAYLNALEGKGVHIVTVNEYLAGREVNGEIGDLFRWLGLTVGLNLRELTQQQKQEAYACDILYSTNSELGFDYLRDNMARDKDSLVQQRGLNTAIIDEVDSVLIDEARTPLIISGGSKDSPKIYTMVDKFVKKLTEEDYEIDLESKTIQLTNHGIEAAEKNFNIKNLYDLDNVNLVHRINNALKANYIFHNQVEYVVQDGEVLIVDSFTGRILKGRQYNDGLHQAIEAKEGVEIKQEMVTVATITYQNFFRMYHKLSGMTGTAKTEEEEFRDIYNMYVVEVPTNRPIQRIDAPDYLFLKAEYKWNALIEEVKARHEKGQPILIGTVSVDTSEMLSRKLQALGLKHEVLNAKNHEREAEIVEHAGELGAITIATNMAGRGTDIKINDEVKALGGLCVFGTERHESRRIDNQLRGRSGRQGDPGFSRFYTSCEDELLERFAGDSFKNKLQFAVSLNSEGDETKPLESRMFTKVMTQAQTRIEGANYDSRKNVLKYDDVIRVQRELLYGQRMQIIKGENIEEMAYKMMKEGIDQICDRYMEEVGRNKFNIDDQGIADAFNVKYYGDNSVDVEKLKTLDENEIRDYLFDVAKKELDEKRKLFPDDAFNGFVKYIVLRVVDQHWTSHIDKMSGLRQGIGLQSYGQQNPLTIYKAEGLKTFNKMTSDINEDVLRYLVRTKIRVEVQHEDPQKGLVTNQAGDDSRKAAPVINARKEIGRNDLCPCGSGKKYKYCCGR
ncbi:MAG: preprotein translocase subunit SecA [Anaeroplasmataceae bacterium]